MATRAAAVTTARFPVATNNASLAGKVCTFPMVLPTCAEPLSAALGGQYRTWQILLLMFGALLLAANAFQSFRVLKRGSSMQKPVYILLCWGSLTVIVNGLDPQGYGNIVPFRLVAISKAVGIAIPYTIFYVVAMVWGVTLKKIAEKPCFLTTHSQLIGCILIAGTWFVTMSSAFRAGSYSSPKFFGGILLALAFICFLGAFFVLIIGYELQKRIREANEGTSRLSSTCKDSGTAPVVPIIVTPSAAGSLPVGNFVEMKEDNSPELRLKSLHPTHQFKKTERPQPENYGCFYLLFSLWQQSHIVRLLVVALGAIVLHEIGMVMKAVGILNGAKIPNQWDIFNLCVASKKSVCVVGMDGTIPFLLQILLLKLATWGFWDMPSYTTAAGVPLDEISEAESLEEGQQARSGATRTPRSYYSYFYNNNGESISSTSQPESGRWSRLANVRSSRASRDEGGSSLSSSSTSLTSAIVLSYRASPSSRQSSELSAGGKPALPSPDVIAEDSRSGEESRKAQNKPSMARSYSYNSLSLDPDRLSTIAEESSQRGTEESVGDNRQSADSAVSSSSSSSTAKARSTTGRSLSTGASSVTSSRYANSLKDSYLAPKSRLDDEAEHLEFLSSNSDSSSTSSSRGSSRDREISSHNNNSRRPVRVLGVRPPLVRSVSSRQLPTSSSSRLRRDNFNRSASHKDLRSTPDWVPQNQNLYATL